MANSHGDRTYLEAKVSDDAGITTTVAAAGTPVALKSAALLVEGQASESCPYTLDAENGQIEVAARHGVGPVRLTGVLGRVKGENAAVIEASWFRIRDGEATELTPRVARTEPAAAADAALAPCIAYDDAQLGDIYELRLDSGTNADEVLVKEASLSIEKLESKG